MLIKNIKDSQIQIFALRNAQDDNKQTPVNELLEMNLTDAFNWILAEEPKELIATSSFWRLVTQAKTKKDYKSLNDLILKSYK
jgi:hypothetical protein